MSAVTALHAADARLAAQIDSLTQAIASVGSLTAAARERLAVALDAARDYLNATVREIAAVVGLTVDAFDIAAGCELLALPADEPIVVHVDSEPALTGDRPPDATPGDAAGMSELTPTPYRLTPTLYGPADDPHVCDPDGVLDVGTTPNGYSEVAAANCIAGEANQAKEEAEDAADRIREADASANACKSGDALGEGYRAKEKKSRKRK